MLVALKKDLRNDPATTMRLQQREGRGTVTTDEAQKAAKELQCDAYIECSSKTGEGVRDVFLQASSLGAGKREKRSSCVIL
jgi:Ras family protein A